MSYKVSIHDADYNYKTRRKSCYFCGIKVNSYKENKCKCKKFDCPLCSEDKPANIPICENCMEEYLNTRKN